MFLPPDYSQDIFALVTADHNGLNSGVFYLKVHNSSVDFLSEIMTYTVSHPDEDLGWNYEQTAMARVISIFETRHRGSGHPSGIAWVPRTWFNSYEFGHGFEGEPGDFLVHFPGLGNNKIRHMEWWLDELKSNQQKWEIGFNETRYKIEVPAFWSNYSLWSSVEAN